MEPVEMNNDGKNYGIRDQLAKLLLGTMAGFLAGKAVEAAYDHFVVDRRNHTPSIQE